MIDPISCDQINVEELLAGPVDQARTATMDQHITSCPACRRRLEELAGSAEWWNECRNALQADGADEECSIIDPPPTGWLTGRPPVMPNPPINAVLSPPSHPEMLGRIGGRPHSDNGGRRRGVGRYRRLSFGCVPVDRRRADSARGIRSGVGGRLARR